MIESNRSSSYKKSAAISEYSEYSEYEEGE